LEWFQDVGGGPQNGSLQAMRGWWPGARARLRIFTPPASEILPQHPQQLPEAMRDKAETVADHPQQIRNAGETRR
jgi:hypothetical protein